MPPKPTNSPPSRTDNPRPDDSTFRRAAERSDLENIFTLYATFLGDRLRTAAALGLNHLEIKKLADDNKWDERLKPLLELHKSGRPDDIARAINRAVNFSQCHRLRVVLDRVLTRLFGMTADELEIYTMSGLDRHGGRTEKLSTRPFADLAAALEKVQAMSYLALGDGATDRSREAALSPKGEEAAAELHVKIADAMQAARIAEAGQIEQLRVSQADVAQALTLKEKREVIDVPPMRRDSHV